MKLITKEIEKKLIANCLENRKMAEETEGGQSVDHKPALKLFHPYGAGAWLITELCPDDKDSLFGLCDLGMGSPELGYVSMQELASLKDGPAPAIERDMYFRANKTLQEYADEARKLQRINA